MAATNTNTHTNITALWDRDGSFFPVRVVSQDLDAEYVRVDERGAEKWARVRDLHVNPEMGVWSDRETGEDVRVMVEDACRGGRASEDAERVAITIIDNDFDWCAGTILTVDTAQVTRPCG